MMEDDFYAPVGSGSVLGTSVGWAERAIEAAKSPNMILALVLGPFIIAIFTRYLSGIPAENGKGEKSAWKVPYWIPYVGHGINFGWDPTKLIKEAKQQSPHADFSLYMGGTTYNIISDPNLVQSVMAETETTVQFAPVAWNTAVRMFGIPKESKPKYDKCWDELNSTLNLLLREPSLGVMTTKTVRNMENSIPSMISFINTDVDLHSWERFSDVTYISDSEISVNLMALMRDMMSNACIPAMYGSAFIEKYPEIAHDVYEMDRGVPYFLLLLPGWTPWSPVITAHNARRRVWEALDDQQRALDAQADGKDIHYSWGEMEDVSAFTRKRNEIYKKNGFEIRERGEFSILWALTVNSSLLVYWQLLYILTTPELVSKLRREIEPYVKIHKPFSIGKFSEAPRITIDHSGLTKHCHLLKSTYFEALRLTDQPWSVRSLASNARIKSEGDSNGYMLRKGEYIILPHDLHMNDPVHFLDPEKFEPERFLVRGEDGKVSGTDMGTIRPYGGGPSLCKGRILAETECLALVAGVLAYWDFEPAHGKKFTVPKQEKTTAVARPVGDTRVKIKRRKFEWDE